MGELRFGELWIVSSPFPTNFLSKWSHRDLFKCSLGHPGQSNLEPQKFIEKENHLNHPPPWLWGSKYEFSGGCRLIFQHHNSSRHLLTVVCRLSWKLGRFANSKTNFSYEIPSFCTNPQTNQLYKPGRGRRSRKTWMFSVSFCASVLVMVMSGSGARSFVPNYVKRSQTIRKSNWKSHLELVFSFSWLFLQEKCGNKPGCGLSVYRLLPYTASTRLFREICGSSLMGRVWCSQGGLIILWPSNPPVLIASNFLHCFRGHSKIIRNNQKQSETIKNNQKHSENKQKHLSLPRFHLELLSMFVQLDVRPARSLKPCWWTCRVLFKLRAWHVCWTYEKIKNRSKTRNQHPQHKEQHQNILPVLSS